MTPQAIIKNAAAEGVRLTLSASGNIKAAGDGAALSRWAAVIREHKAAIVGLLAAANDPVTLPTTCTTSAASNPKTFVIALPGREPFGVSCPQGENAVRAQWPTAISIHPV